ncbi:MAG TPA: HD domain-containing protein [Chloroflexota bacterium]|jgi:HD superfamily phosphohydrolase|nr:HD domain-containing protein [Chloroflexota bacterium]
MVVEPARAPERAAAADALTAQIQQFAEDVMRGYAGTPPRRAKYLRDALHGSIVVEPHEVPFVDAPLFQRLRGIFQTGPVFLTYPSARHSRFEHGVGVMHLAGRMVRRLAELDPTLPAAHCRAVRLAALLHDIGHGIFSHSSEKVIAATPLLAAQLDPALPGQQPHEKVGALLLRSAPMRRLFEQADIDPEIVVALVTHDLDALRARRFPLYLAGVISGPIDADKLDYFARDSLFSGVPAILDYDRLLQSLVIGEHGIQLSMAGAAELEKLLFNRLTMYHALYNHHKVQTADCMIQAVIEAIVGPAFGTPPAQSGLVVATLDSQPPGAASVVDFRRVVDFLRLGDEALLHAPAADPYVADVLHRLRTRRLLQRAFVLQRDTVTNLDDDTYLDYADAVRRHAEQVRQHIFEAVRRQLPTLRPGDLWVRPAVVPRVTDHHVIATAPGEPARHPTIFSGWLPDVTDRRVTNPVQRNYLLYKAPIYVLAPPEHLATVEQAAHHVLRELFDDLLPRVRFLPRHR